MRSFVGQSPDSFGGIWLTYPPGGTGDNALTLNVNVTSSVEPRIVATLQGLTPAGATLHVHQVSYSEEYLDSLHPLIANDREFFESIGVKLYSIETRVPDNRVNVSVSRLDSRVERSIAERYGAAVEVRAGNPVIPDACSRTNCGPPWKGGLKIARPGPAYCTSGFVVRKLSGSSYVYALWTAGHCGSGTWKLSGPTGIVIGPTSVVHFRNGIKTDVQVIPISSTNKTNKIIDDLASCTDCGLRSFTGQQGHNGDEFGDTVCNNGYNTGRTCGTIRSTNFTFVWEDEGVTLFEFRRATYARTGGDSGGPVYTTAGSLAAGSHTHFENIGGVNYPVYAHVYWMTQYTGYSVNPTP